LSSPAREVNTGRNFRAEEQMPEHKSGINPSGNCDFTLYGVVVFEDAQKMPPNAVKAAGEQLLIQPKSSFIATPP
jgi:hypothetical protein